jgi:Flp pilus assembly protein TadD
MYEKALTFRPNEPTVLSNLGMSYLLEGKLAQAENLSAPGLRSPAPTAGCGRTSPS